MDPLRPERHANESMFDRCPNEILLMFAAPLRNTPKTYTSALAALARTSQRFRPVFEEELYKYNIRRQGSSVMAWAASKGLISTMEKAVHFGAPIDSPVEFEVQIQHRPSDPSLTTARQVTAPPLHYAVVSGEDDAVCWLLDREASLDSGSNDMCRCWFDDDLKMLPLHLSICHERTSTAKILLSRGAGLILAYRPDDPKPPPIRDEYESHAWHFACYMGNVDLVRFLEDKYQGISHSRLRNNATALHAAASAHGNTALGAMEVINFLLKAGLTACLNDESGTASEGHSALDLAFMEENWSAALVLLRHGAQLLSEPLRVDLFILRDPPEEWGIHGFPYLGLSFGMSSVAPNIRTELLREFLRHQSPYRRGMGGDGDGDIKALFKDLWDGFCSNDNEPVLELLGHAGDMLSGSQILDLLKLKVGRKSPWFCKDGEFWKPSVQKLVTLGADLHDTSYPVFGMEKPVLGSEMMHGSETCLTACIEPASVAYACHDNRMWNPLDPDMISALLEVGAPVNLPNRAGKTPLHLALTVLRDKCLKGSRVNPHAAHPVALRSGWRFVSVQELSDLLWATINCLLGHDASLSAQDLDGKTPMDLAIELSRDSDVDIAQRGVAALKLLEDHAAARARLRL